MNDDYRSRLPATGFESAMPKPDPELELEPGSAPRAPKNDSGVVVPLRPRPPGRSAPGTSRKWRAWSRPGCCRCCVTGRSASPRPLR